MNREADINKFLKKFAKMYMQNPNLTINEDTFYYDLMNYGLTEVEVNNKNIRTNFDKWVEYFKEDQNLNVFHTERQNSFLQFHSKRFSDTKCVKLYVSISKDKIYECVNRIFSYISSNDMPTFSKVADTLRSDSVVIRLDRPEDAKKVIDFINNDPLISQSCKPVNPFLLKSGNVGIAYDNMLSYNSTITLILEQYFKSCRKNNSFDKVSLSDFREYVINFYRNTFNNRNNLNNFLNLYQVYSQKSRFYGDIGALIVNYEQVTRLILESLKPNMNIDDYFKFYNRCLDEKNNEIMIDYYNELLSNSHDQNENKIDISNEDVALLNSFIEYAAPKYGGDSVAGRLRSYRDNPRAITRDRDYRNSFITYLPYEKILQITNNNIDAYVENYLSQKQKLVQSVPKKSNNSLKNYNLFLKACIATYEKYGEDQLYIAITASIKGDYSYFTNAGYHRYRDNLIKSNLTNEIIGYCSLIEKEYGNGGNVYNLYKSCVRAIANLVYQKRQDLQTKIN